MQQRGRYILLWICGLLVSRAYSFADATSAPSISTTQDSSDTLPRSTGVPTTLSVSAIPPEEPPETEEDRKRKRAVLMAHPLADMTRVNLENWYTPKFGGYTTALRVFWSHPIGSIDQVSRLTIPYVVHGSSRSHSSSDVGNLDETTAGSTGLGDIEFYTLSVIARGQGEIKIGPTFSFPSASGKRSAGKWCIGPAGGYVWDGDLLQAGFFTQSIFSFEGDSDKSSVAKTKIQPILLYNLSHDWAVGLSQMNFTYDWHNRRWSSIPVGLQVDKLIHVGSQPINLISQAEYNMADNHDGNDWTIRFTISFLTRDN